MNKIQEYYRLRKELLNYAYHYYCLNESLISDEEYDKLYEKVLELKKELNIKDEQIEKVNLGFFEGDKKDLRKVKHPIPMLSIEKKKEDSYISEKVVILKIDGVALELIYKNGELAYILTRGDGEYGLDITYLVEKLNVPKAVYDFRSFDTTIVRGELVSEKDKNNKNHRNIVAGYINRIEDTPDNLSLMAYHLFVIKNDEDVLGFKYSDRLDILKKHFTIPPFVILHGKINYDVWYQKLKEKTDIPCDGLVITYNISPDINDRTAKHFRWNYCWKPESEIKETKLIDVIWQIGKRGTITPVGIVKPVEIGGATVQKVSLSNLHLIRQKDIAINDIVLITRSNDIIPYIVEVKERPEDRVSIDISICPNCGNPVEIKNNGMQIYCHNPECSGVARIEYFCKVLGIKGLGKKTIEYLNEVGVLEEPKDLYKLSLNDWINILDSEKKGTKIYENVQKSKEANIIKLLTALNIPLVGEASLKLLNESISIIKDGEINPQLYNYEILVNVNGFGEVRATNLINFLVNFNLNEWIELGFTNLTQDTEVVRKSIAVISGKVDGMTRNEVKEMLSKYFDFRDNVTKDVDILIVGKNPGKSKIEKATKYGIPIKCIDEIMRKIKGENF